MTKDSDEKNGRWIRNAALARYLGVTTMTVWRWQRDPALDFPQPSVINGISFTRIDEIDAWMRKRVANLAKAGEAA